MRSPASEWDYGDVAAAYVKRPAYAPAALADVLAAVGVGSGMCVCDVGAGTGTVALALAAAGLSVVALEPNATMRALGRQRTAAMSRICWVGACAEATALGDATFDLVTFGSSFNCVDRRSTLAETARILRARGAVVCLWNHRRLDDPLQARIEAAIRDVVPEYAYGARREDPTRAFEEDGLFTVIAHVERDVVHRLPVADWLAAWRSHLTLKRQAGSQFAAVLEAIDRIVRDSAGRHIDVPYTTCAWIARRRSAASSATGREGRSGPE